MTMRRLFAVGLLLSGLSIIPWVRADGTNEKSCCDPVVAAEADECNGENHDEAMQRYRSNHSRHWRHMLVGGK